LGDSLKGGDAPQRGLGIMLDPLCFFLATLTYQILKRRAKNV